MGYEHMRFTNLVYFILYCCCYVTVEDLSLRVLPVCTMRCNESNSDSDSDSDSDSEHLIRNNRRFEETRTKSSILINSH